MNYGMKGGSSAIVHASTGRCSFLPHDCWEGNIVIAPAFAFVNAFAGLDLPKWRRTKEFQLRAREFQRTG
jgi:hypothetical protein